MSATERKSVTVSDLARAAQVHEQIVLRWVRGGQLPAPLVQPGTWRCRAYKFAPEVLELARQLGSAQRLLRGRRGGAAHGAAEPGGGRQVGVAPRVVAAVTACALEAAG